MKKRELIVQEQGIAMILVVLIGAMVTLLSIVLIDQVRGESNRSVHQVYGGTSFQAAEAGVGDYVSKLVDDSLYYLHWVHPAEATRQSGATTVAAGGAWTAGQTWTYPNGKDAWRRLPTGCAASDPRCYEYNLRVYPPNATSKYVRIVAAGRKADATQDVRVIETFIRPSSLADYYRVVNGDVNFGDTATTNGKIYANGRICHDGVATADIFAEGQINSGCPGSPSVTLQNGAIRYDVDTNPDIRDKIKVPIDFTSFLASFTDIERAADLAGPGVYHLNEVGVHAWRLTFNASGTVTIEKCFRAGAAPNHVADKLPTCNSAIIRAVPANGAIYVEQDAIVRGSVKGRVTVASSDNIIVGGNINFVTSGQDVLGLVAKNYVWIAKYVPDPLVWSAGVISQSQTWGFGRDTTYNPPGVRAPWGTPKNLMTFRGMAATEDGGDFSTMFNNRDYGYDESFLWLPPPWFPVVEDAYTVLFFRELPAAT